MSMIDRPGGPREGQFVVMIDGHAHEVRIWERGVGLRGPWERQKQHWEEDRLSPRFPLYATRPVTYDKNATGELNASILGYSSRRSSWGARKRWSLEDRLPQLVRDLEVQAVEARTDGWPASVSGPNVSGNGEAAMERAEVRLISTHRRECLRERVRAWQEAEAIRD
jgi:hypothetical protein